MLHTWCIRETNNSLDLVIGPKVKLWVPVPEVQFLRCYCMFHTKLYKVEKKQNETEEEDIKLAW